MEKNDNFKPELETQYNILIKASAKEERKRSIMMMVILIITFIAVLVSIFFSYKAYKNSSIIDNDSPKEVKTFYQTLSITYNNTNKLSLSKIGNGYELATPKTIQITNEGDSDILFDIKLTSINTSLLSTNNFYYTLLKNDEVKVTKEFPLSDKIIASDNKISAGETITYILKASFKGTIEENNYSNYYNSKIVIEPKNNQLDLLD